MTTADALAAARIALVEGRHDDARRIALGWLPTREAVTVLEIVRTITNWPTLAKRRPSPRLDAPHSAPDGQTDTNTPQDLP